MSAASSHTQQVQQVSVDFQPYLEHVDCTRKITCSFPSESGYKSYVFCTEHESHVFSQNSEVGANIGATICNSNEFSGFINKLSRNNEPYIFSNPLSTATRVILSTNESREYMGFGEQYDTDKKLVVADRKSCDDYWYCKHIYFDSAKVSEADILSSMYSDNADESKVVSISILDQTVSIGAKITITNYGLTFTVLTMVPILLILVLIQ